VAATDTSTPGSNRLAGETSPYLRMHADNPVDWYPWGQEALEKARRENKPIFLSIGYSSCYWCHVMARESFTDKEIAEYLNAHYVCIKVDREERPDVDAIYMMAVQIITQQGGWPLSVFLTPEGKPFFGGTYFPPRDGDRGVQTGFLTILRRVHELWQQEATQIRQNSDQLTGILQEQFQQPESGERPETESLEAALQEALQTRFDSAYGGFGFHPQQPQIAKFPEPSNLWFLLHRASIDRDPKALAMLTATLDGLSRGGIWDHLGGGFHRYSTDRYWEVPHFEKMLYDNAQLLSVFARAFEVTGKEEYRQVAQATAEFVLREMTSPEGSFYSAIDAETNQVEGAYYRWTRQEVQAVLPEDDLRLFSAAYGLDDPPNMESAYYVLHRTSSWDDLAAQLQMDSDTLQARLADMRKRLLGERQKRERPLVDTKILAAWNGLMIRGLADAGRILKEPRYLEAAGRAARFLVDQQCTDDGRLLRTWSDGKAKLTAYVDDYAFAIDGLLALHGATGERQWLDQAGRWMELQLKHYQDAQRGGFYFNAHDHAELIVRIKQYVDEVQPSGNSVSVSNLADLSQALDRPEYLEAARRCAGSAAAQLADSPLAVPRLITSLAELPAQPAR
jgi:uncharacterized protein YyaL (SSP411 family)